MKQKIERLRSLLGGTKVNGVCLTDLLSHIDALEARVEEAETIAGIATIPDVAGMAERLEAAERDLADAVEERDALRSASTIIRERDEAVEVLSGIKWRSDDRDNMEFAARITYSQMDRIRAFLTKRGEK